MPAPLPRPISQYYDALKTFAAHGAHTEGATRIAFQQLRSDTGRARGFALLAEQTIALPNNKTIRLDGEVKDQFQIRRGVWEAKDTADDPEYIVRLVKQVVAVSLETVQIVGALPVLAPLE